MKKSSKKQKTSGPLEIKSLIPENLTFGSTLKCKNIKLFTAIIKALSFVNNSEIQLSNAGFKYVVEESKSFQAIAYIQKDFFSDYFIKLSGSDMISFGVNLTSFTDLLSGLIGNDSGSTMNISFFERENQIVFCVLQTDKGDSNKHYTDNDVEDLAGEIRTEYFMRTMLSIEPIDFTIDDPELFHSIIINAPDFLSLLSDFDRTISEINIKITEHKMTMKSIGILQYASTAKYKSDSEIFDKYECYQPSQFSYRFNYFKVIMKGVALASKVSISTQLNGAMRVQLMVPSDDDSDPTAFIEYNLTPNLPEEEEEEDKDDE